MKDIEPNDRNFWFLQLLGWSFFILFYKVSKYSGGVMDSVHHGSLWVFVATGILLTHLMRVVVKRFRLLEKPPAAQVMGFVATTILMSVLQSLMQITVYSFAGLRLESESGTELARILVRLTIHSAFVFAIWSSFYCLYHYIANSALQQIESLRVANDFKELELRWIKSQVNPHFIFNSLNGIRALVDEDRSRAREALSSLGNILRSNFQASHGQTVSLLNELSLVKDYLSLEHIRFEDRLRVDYSIDPATHGVSVPVMMLHTLVENAVKHGIGRQVQGGVVSISSKLTDDGLELLVGNTGRYDPDPGNCGFGVGSVVKRLSILYGEHAGFDIRQSSVDKVEARLVLPLQSNETTLDAVHPGSTDRSTISWLPS
jgi:two-component system LytT family sensor kinase